MFHYLKLVVNKCRWAGYRRVLDFVEPRDLLCRPGSSINAFTHLYLNYYLSTLTYSENLGMEHGLEKIIIISTRHIHSDKSYTHTQGT